MGLGRLVTVRETLQKLRVVAVAVAVAMEEEEEEKGLGSSKGEVTLPCGPILDQLLH